MPLMPSMLLGLLGIAIPVMIHLLHRQQTRPVQWGAMQFLRQSTLRMKQKKNVDHWLLMVLRMLAIGLVAFLLARPRVSSNALSSAGVTETPADVAVIIDHSLSTGRLSNGKTVFAHSVDVLNQLLDRLSSEDTISVVLAEHQPRPITLLPIRKSDVQAVSQLRQTLAQLGPGMTDCSIPQAVSTARHLLSHTHNQTRTLLIVSDTQRVNWHVKDRAMWQSALREPGNSEDSKLAIHCFPIAPDALMNNASVSALNIEPTILGIHRPVQITAQIANLGAGALPGMTARLFINGVELQTKPVAPLAVKAAATIRFDLEAGLAEVGSHSIKVSIDAVDGLAADNAVYAVANVLKNIPVLVIDGEFSEAGGYRTSRFLAAALQPTDASLVKPTVVSIAQASSQELEDFSVVVLNDLPMLPTALCDRLNTYVRGGHGLWFILGKETRPSMIDNDLASNGLFSSHLRQQIDSTRQPSGLEIKDPTNPIVRMMVENQQNALVGISIRKWWAIDPADSQTVLSAGNGDPLALERVVGSSGGLVDIWMTSVDGTWNNLNLVPDFVPLVNETIYHLAAASLHGLENHALDAGQPIEWAGAGKQQIQNVQIARPDGTSVSHPAAFNSGRWLMTDPDTFLPGIYHLTFTPSQIQPVDYAINIDRAELDPTLLNSTDIDWLKNEKILDANNPVLIEGALPQLIVRTNKRTEVWGLLGAVLLAGLLMETLLTYRMIAAKTRVDVAQAGLQAWHTAG